MTDDTLEWIRSLTGCFHRKPWDDNCIECGRRATRKYPTCTGENCYTCFLDMTLFGEIYLEMMPDGQARHINPKYVTRRYHD